MQNQMKRFGYPQSDDKCQTASNSGHAMKIASKDLYLDSNHNYLKETRADQHFPNGANPSLDDRVAELEQDDELNEEQTVERTARANRA